MLGNAAALICTEPATPERNRNAIATEFVFQSHIGLIALACCRHLFRRFASTIDDTVGLTGPSAWSRLADEGTWTYEDRVGDRTLSSLSDLRSQLVDAAASAKAMARLKSLTGFGVKLALTGGILWFVLQLVDLAAMRASFAAMNWAVLGAALLQMLIIPLLGGVRWKLVLVAMRAKGHTWPLSRLFWISMLFGQVLPSTVGGDVVRVFMMWRSSKSLRIAFNSVALERASMLLTLLLFVALQLAFLDFARRRGPADLDRPCASARRHHRPDCFDVRRSCLEISAGHAGGPSCCRTYPRMLAKFIFRGRAGVCSLFA